MLFAHDTEVALTESADLVNTLGDGHDDLADVAGLQAFLEQHPYTGQRLGTDDELVSVRALRDRLRTLWETTDRDAAAAIVNEMLAEADAKPFLTRHDEWDWHLHLTPPDAPLASRIGAEAAMGFLDLIRAGDLSRLRTCAADDCDDVLVDLSRNSSKRYCDTDCGNRTNVAAYRVRKKALEQPHQA